MTFHGTFVRNQSARLAKNFASWLAADPRTSSTKPATPGLSAKKAKEASAEDNAGKVIASTETASSSPGHLATATISDAPEVATVAAATAAEPVAPLAATTTLEIPASALAAPVAALAALTETTPAAALAVPATNVPATDAPSSPPVSSSSLTAPSTTPLSTGATFAAKASDTTEAPAPTSAPADSAAADPSLAAHGAIANMADWKAAWKSAAGAMPCSSCTGRSCTVCSIRIGGPTATNGMPSGYAPRVLEYYDPTDASKPLGASIAPAGLTATDTNGATSGLTGISQAAEPLAAPAITNPIVLENMKQGTPESVWMIDTADDSIEGFADQFTIDHGNTVNFKINTDSKNYRIDIYRLGYYGGDGARLVTTINKTLTTAQVQPVPLFDPTLNLVDAGNWSVSASWAIPSDAVSGVYIAELTRLDGSRGQNMIPFVVRDDEAKSDITFQTSDTTWEAYNWWGGYNFYGGIDEGGRAGRAYAVSYNRPFNTRDGGFAAGPQDFVFGEEYPAIRFLEQNGYDINYISGIDTARSASQLLNSKIFMSVGHDEYWSADQRANVEAARDAGVNLAFMSGNEVYWETRWAPSIDGTGTPYKTLVSYKERWANDNIDTAGTTSTWRDPQLGAGDPENSLTGTIFTVDSYRLDTIQIPYSLSNFRFWSNTAVANIQPGQVYSLEPNLLGYEWDSDLDNGSRPAGLVPLSDTTVDVNSLLLDYGSTTGAGTADHSLTLYRAPSGALVFGAGTVYWSWGLDDHHDNEDTPTDPNVQQAMVNLFADMGVQPATLMQSLAVAQQSTDHAAPSSTITSPTTTGTYTAGTPITVTGTATDTGGGIVAVVEVSTDNGQTWHRADGFGNWTYSFTPLAGGSYTIKSRAVDDSINMETPNAGRTITVGSAPITSLFPTDVPVIKSDDELLFVNLGTKFTSTQNGTVVGIRYYKGLGDGGTHVGSLWSSTGQLLATGTFTGETASGWQTLTFTNPVSISAGTSYIVSYHSNGQYAATDNYFANGSHTNGPLTAIGGYFAYGDTNAFPASASAQANYFADVIFSSTVTANLPPVGTNDNGFVTAINAPITFQAATLLANDTDPNGDVLSISGAGAASGGTVAYNSQTGAITFTPTNGFVGPASFGYSISDGRGGVGSAMVNLTVGAVSLFSPTDTPDTLEDSDAQQVNLGVRFTASQAGTISGIRYYKSPGDTGTHTGSLWNSNGTLLATATFTNETTSGWQSVTFSSPVTIAAGTTYVASFHSNGHYSFTGNYFDTAHTSGPLTAPTGNGVYTYGTGNAMPTSTFGGSNYWVDVVYSPTGGATNHPPVAANDTGFTTQQNTPLQLAGATLLSNDTDQDGDSLTITGVSNFSNGTAVFNAQNNTVTFTPTTGYTGAAGFTYAVSDGRGGTSSATVSLTVSAAVNQPPVANNDSGFATQQNTALQITAASLLANDTDPNGDPLTVTGVSGFSNGTATFNAQSNTVTFTPTTGYTGSAGFTYAISDGRGGTASASVALTVTAPATGVSLFAANSTPATITENDASSVELGMKFTVSANGTINGIRFYKGPQNVGTHTGHLWSSTGTLLGSLTFSGESASGWQTATFNSPIAVTAGTTYIVSYHTNGFYSANGNYFTTAQTNGPITAPAGSNGVYAYGTGAPFPTNTYNSSNYWVDVLYSQAAQGPNRPPVANNDTGFTTQQSTALQIAAASLLANDTDPDGNPLTITGVSGFSNGTATFNAQNNTVTFTPTAGYTGAAGFTYAISDGNGGTASANVSLTVTAPPVGVSLFAANSVPATVNINETAPVELGMKFTASTAGTITGIRFYKGSSNTGTHTGSLWTSTGTRLGTVTFNNESASGWQTASFATPIAITAGTTYVVSYHSNGAYSADNNYFATTRTNGPLTAPSSSTSGGNGVYAYGSTSAFPNSSFNASNYWVDVIFNGQVAA